MELHLFYRHINNKCESIVQQQDQNRVYKEPVEISELLNISLQKDLTNESRFEPSGGGYTRLECRRLRSEKR